MQLRRASGELAVLQQCYLICVCVCVCSQRGCQTRAVHSIDSKIQTSSTTETCTQTEPWDQRTEEILYSPDDPEPPGLLDFLLRVEQVLIRELTKNSRSHAFDGFQVNWSGESKQVSVISA